MHLSFIDSARDLELPKAFALVVGGAPESIYLQDLRMLAQAASLVIAADSGADHLAAAFADQDTLLLESPSVIDYLVGDFDSVSDKGRCFAQQQGATLVSVPADKDFTDIQLALSTVTEAGLEKVVLTNVTGGRLDHTLAVIGAMLASCELQPLAIGKTELLCVLGAAADARFSVALADLGCKPGDEFSILAPAGPAGVSESGVRWPLKQRLLEPLDGLGVSNVVESVDARVNCNSGVILVVISHGCGKVL